MRECRFFPWCSYIENHGCTKDSCRHYQPMPDVGALLALSNEIYDTSCDNHGELTVDLIDIWGWAQAICEALGVES